VNPILAIGIGNMVQLVHKSRHTHEQMRERWKIEM